jgi:hypothetical protein
MIASFSNGPFQTDTAVGHVFNVIARYGPDISRAIVCGAGAMGVYLLAAGPLSRLSLFRYRGPTRCGACGYALATLRKPICPECGKSL